MTREEFLSQPKPKSHENENLETVSRNKLRLLFQPDLFELRDELQNDKGIDLSVEIKHNGASTNLRFPIQLKASNSIKKNKDNSISFEIKVSNINYLMNDGMPALYVLYDYQRDMFYYEKTQIVDENFNSKYKTTPRPETFTIRFSKILNDVATKSIHDEVLSLGFLRRNLNEVLKLRVGTDELETTLVIKKNQEVYSVEEKIVFLEKYGYRLLNEGRFKAITDIEKQCINHLGNSAAYHFVCGAAQYYQSRFYDALSHFNQVVPKATELNPEIQNMLQFYIVQSKHSLGIFDAERTSGLVEPLLNSEYLGLNLKLTKAYDDYLKSELPEPDNSIKFHEKVSSVKDDNHCDESLWLMAEIYEITVLGHQINDDLLNYLIAVRSTTENPLIPLTNPPPSPEKISKYNLGITELKAKAVKQKNHNSYYIICLNSVKIHYMSMVYTTVILGADKNTLAISKKLDKADVRKLQEQVNFVAEIASAFDAMHSMENMVAALSQQYELLHFLDRFSECSAIMTKMEEIITRYSIHGLEGKLRHLEEKGTVHEKFEQLILGGLSKSKLETDEVRDITAEINNIDIQDTEQEADLTETDKIEIFPFGFFYFKKELKEEVLKILNVTDEAKTGYRNLWQIPVVPVANIYNNPIRKEGYAKGVLDQNGIGSLRHLLKVRRELYKNKIHRFVTKFG